jgi:hypothetical protein
MIKAWSEMQCGDWSNPAKYLTAVDGQLKGTGETAAVEQLLPCRAFSICGVQLAAAGLGKNHNAITTVMQLLAESPVSPEGQPVTSPRTLETQFNFSVRQLSSDAISLSPHYKLYNCLHTPVS